VVPRDHLDDISNPENLFLFSRSIQLLHLDIIDATAHVQYYVSQGEEEHHHTRALYPLTSRGGTLSFFTVAVDCLYTHASMDK
jgi:hypothetical protein